MTIQNAFLYGCTIKCNRFSTVQIMLIYVISAVRLNRDHTRITDVLWEQLGGIEYVPIEASVTEVVEVLTTGNKVFLILRDAFGAWINTYTEFKPVSYPDGEVGITNTEYQLDELPTF